MDSDRVGKTILFLRKHYNMTQHELAEKLGVTDKAVSRWENGYGTPDISLLSRLSIILDVDIESILEGNLTNCEKQWKGLLFLNYSDDISPMDMLYSIRIVEFQMSFFLLAGINRITVVGSEKYVCAVQDFIGDGRRFGCKIEYVKTEDSNKKVVEKVIVQENNESNLMIITNLGFIYGKDLTKYFKRIMNENAGEGQLMNYLQKPSGISFFKQGRFKEWCSIENIYLERGVISFSICGREDLMDASNLLLLLEKHNSEKIADLHDIALRRGFVDVEVLPEGI